MKYTHLFFDADNTLLDFDTAEEQALQSACAALHMPYSKDLLSDYKTVNDVVWKEFERGLIDARVLRTERFRRLSLKKGYNRIDPEAMSKHYLSALSHNDTPLPGALDLISSLSSHHTVGIITNGLREVQEGRFATSPLSKYLSFIVISDVIGCKKPEHEFFLYAHKKAGMPPKNHCLVIGDSLRSDIYGGNCYGFDTCWFTPDETGNNSDIQPTYTVHRLDQIPALVSQ